ncbi:hypothetical protein DM02DRAFT_731404 [Periconia macrospinosa]|uniref:C2H2-type domain-containing protein n=1 Tax=Periconia macrospinosa TaxID=97972 RepID=A0A2V1DG23_9PLEO|nr:hypothetical protein DM02DRAFT_731404 [Periconia macrospinosa]
MDNEAKTMLEKAIMTATLPRLRNTFWEICLENPQTASIACKKLLSRTNRSGNNPFLSTSPSHDTANLSSEDEEVQHEKRDEHENRKRKRDMFPTTTSVVQPRYDVCEQCDKEYDVEYNSATACIYHPGLLDGTEEFYEDVYDDDEFDHEEMFADSPELYEWNCCGRQGGKAGYKKGPHRPKKNRNEAKVRFIDR